MKLVALSVSINELNRTKCEMNLLICKRARQGNTLWPRHNGRHFPDDIFKCIFLNDNVRIPVKISLTFVPKVQINNISAMVQIKVSRRPGDKPLYEPMMVNLPTHICVSRPQ